MLEYGLIRASESSIAISKPKLAWAIDNGKEQIHFAIAIDIGGRDSLQTKRSTHPSPSKSAHTPNCALPWAPNPLSVVTSLKVPFPMFFIRVEPTGGPEPFSSQEPRVKNKSNRPSLSKST